MPPKKKRGGAARTAVAKPKNSPVKSADQTVTKKPEVRRPFVPKFTEIITRSKGRGKKADDCVDNPSDSETTPPDSHVSETSEEKSSAVEELEESKEQEIKAIAPKEEVTMDTDDSQDEYLNMQEQEAIISQQLSNLEFEMSNVEIIKTNRIELIDNNAVENDVGKDSVEFIDNFESEIIIECVSDVVIPIAGEQEVSIENETETIEEIKTEEVEPMEEDIDKEDQNDKDCLETIEVQTNAEMNREIKEDEIKEEDELEKIREELKSETIEVVQLKPQVIEEIDREGDSNETEILKELKTIKIQKPKKPKLKIRTPKKKQPEKKTPNSTPENEVRRSSRIKSISVQKQKSKSSTALQKPKEDSILLDQSSSIEEKPTLSVDPSPKFAVPLDNQRPVKVKSRWRRSSELEQSSNFNSGKPPEITQVSGEPQPDTTEVVKRNEEEVQKRLKQFVHLKENLYLTERVSCKEAKKMTCDCCLSEEEIESGEFGCGEDCLNRLLMIECGCLCALGDRCSNKKFQKGEFAPCEVFCTEKKGLGIRAAANIPYGEFILEYVGEVLDPEEFEKRATNYSSDKNQHYYFMALRADAVIDATRKGSISRFINHSCDPNAETQKWTVNGELRIGFFSKRTILAGEEITFDYQFQRYGKEAQKCYCEAPSCRGWLGEEPDEDDEDEDEEEEEEDEEEGDEESDQKKDVAKTTTEAIEEEKEAVEIPEVKKETEGEPIVAEVKEKVVKKKEKRKSARARLPRKDLFEDPDLDEEIETLQTTGLKNQAQTLKLSRLMVRAKEPAQRTKLLRVLRRGELPCRRLFLDYHGLRLIHGWMTDAQHMAKQNKKLESQRLEILQTLATLPIPNKTMLQDSKVLPTVERWSKKSDETSNLDSDSNSPKIDPELEVKEEKPNIVESEKPPTTELPEKTAEETQTLLPSEEMDDSPMLDEEKESKMEESNEQLPNYEIEIMALGLKLLDEWSVLKEVFRIPKKERIEQMKEHEREADRKYRAGLGLEQDLERKYESRYGTILKRQKKKKDEKTTSKDLKSSKDDHMSMLEKYQRRKLFALQVEQQELERRRKQQEIWRQHEQRCMSMGTDPKFTAPFDPNQGLRTTMIWNPQISQWQSYPLPANFNPNPASNIYPFSQVQSTQIAINKLVQTPPPPVVPKSPYGQPYRPVVPTMPPMAFGVPQPQQHVMYPPPGQGDIGNYHAMQNGKMMQQHLVAKQPPLPALPYQECISVQEDPSQVKFMGPIPPPVKLPPKWKCAKDKYGRPYYYHVRIRKPQWEPPELPPQDLDESSETSSSDTSSLSSDTSTEESDSDDEIDDARLLLHMKNKCKMLEANKVQQEVLNDDNMQEDVLDKNPTIGDGKDKSLESRLMEEFAVLKEDTPPQSKKRRSGLVTEILISPRTEQDKLQFKQDMKRYKANKEKLKQQKERLELSKRQLAVTKSLKQPKKPKVSVKTKLKELVVDTEAAKKIKETFRSSMAVVMVSILNPYRKPDCKEGRIANTEDFKHLARKLTHFVMLKELKHCQNIQDLTVTDSVKSKAKEFVRKYMSKFGEIYQKPKDDPEFQ